MASASSFCGLGGTSEVLGVCDEVCGNCVLGLSGTTHWDEEQAMEESANFGSWHLHQHKEATNHLQACPFMPCEGPPIWLLPVFALAKIP